uniref:TACO1/YebC-like second and third domain-containing protein n=1 Tax=Zooxanthella nutricula TaxID=1333877 RepID=A0A7S2QCL1_9DINO|mmetsp:Transcript_85554/g.261652  ORF Transcript_85554/g.261652 Transcript_85554/m.261652 type:complete len:229 (+) Transcript_85554:121-807(+)
MAVREGGADEGTNTRLARAIKAAIRDNVPRDTVTKRIKKYIEGSEKLDPVVCSGYGPGGIAFIAECFTDNGVRTRQFVSQAIKEWSGQLGSEGAVDHLFNRHGVLKFSGVDEETLMEAGMEADVEDFVPQEDGTFKVLTEPSKFHSAQQVFEKLNLEPDSGEVLYSPQLETEVSEQHSYELRAMIYSLEELDDVSGVTHNAKLDDSHLELKFNQYGQALPYERALTAK